MVNTVYLAGPAARQRPGLQLQYLDVSDCPAVDDTSVRLAVENCTQLLYLFLRRCTNITGEDRISWVRSCCIRHNFLGGWTLGTIEY